LDDVLDKAKPKSEFYGLLAKSILHNAPSIPPGSWLGPNGPLEMRLTDDDLRISGTYEVDANPFAAVGMLGLGKLKLKHRVEYLMTLAGHAMFGVVKRIKEGEVPSAAASALALGDNETKVLMVLSENETQIRVMENPYSSSPTFYSITQSTAIA
jgi:hypothetical protein